MLGLAILQLGLWLLLTSGSSFAAETIADLKMFFGRYGGQSIALEGKNRAQTLDLGVTISPYNDDGFKIEWTAIVPGVGATSKTNEKLESVYFRPYRKRPGMYYSAAKKDIFGNMQSVDPISGTGYFWAGLSGKTLTVNALYVMDAIGWEVQVYRRTVTPDGLVTEFERIRDGFQEKSVTGNVRKLN